MCVCGEKGAGQGRSRGLNLSLKLYNPRSQENQIEKKRYPPCVPPATLTNVCLPALSLPQMPGAGYLCCPKCKRKTFTLKSLFRHFHAWHGHESNWICGLQGCLRTFSLYTSYRRHVTRNHARLLDDAETERFSDTANARSDLGEPQVELEGDEAVCNEQHLQEEGDPARSLALLFLKWKEGRRLPESTVNEIANDVLCYLQRFAESYKSPTTVLQQQPKLKCLTELEKLRTQSGRNSY